MLKALATSILALLLCVHFAAAQPGEWAGQCVTGAHAAPPGSALELDPLLWTANRADYRRLALTAGPVAALDSIVARGERLLGEAGVDPAATGPREALHWRLLELHEQLIAASGTPPSFDRAALRFSSWFGDLQPQVHASPGVVLFAETMDESRTDLRFPADNPEAAIVLCALSQTSHQFFSWLVGDQLKAIAAEYAEVVRDWDAYVRQGYSMTGIERFVHSCHLGTLTWILAPTAARGCNSDALRPLAPPRLRTVLLHPSAGIAPVFDSTGTFRSVAAVEWFGILHHSYDESGVRTWGASLATTYYEQGRPRFGGMFHTPWGRVGLFERSEGPYGGKLHLVFTFDVWGLVSGARDTIRRSLEEAVEARVLESR